LSEVWLLNFLRLSACKFPRWSLFFCIHKIVPRELLEDNADEVLESQTILAWGEAFRHTFHFFTVKLAIFSFLAMDQSIIPKGYRNIQKGAHETAQRLGGQLGLAGPIIHAAGPFDQKGRPKW
jgi:predicted membrane protein